MSPFCSHLISHQRCCYTQDVSSTYFGIFFSPPLFGSSSFASSRAFGTAGGSGSPLSINSARNGALYPEATPTPRQHFNTPDFSANDSVRPTIHPLILPLDQQHTLGHKPQIIQRLLSPGATPHPRSLPTADGSVVGRRNDSRSVRVGLFRGS